MCGCLDTRLLEYTGGPEAHLQVGGMERWVDVPGSEPMQGQMGRFQAGQRRTLSMP